MSLPINSLYSLTWGDYGTSLVSAVQLLRCHGDLVDCTLAAGGRSFPAHKIVLCAASPFLLDLLKNTPCKHPVVMLAGVNANDLEALLEFVYRGEVSVDHSQLPSLLQAAHCLNIQGLAPQTVSKDDYTTSIQLHPSLLPQHHVKIDMNGMNEELITTIQESPPHQTVQAHVVEEILPHSLTEVSDVKDVISQFLPARKRKPRAKKPTQVAKLPRLSNDPNQQIQTQTQIQNQIQTQIQTQTQIQIPSPEIITPSTPPPMVTETVTEVKTVNDKTPDQPIPKPKSRSQSEQPASCPICGAVIRQSRNLRRHLELRHFSKPGVKKEKKNPSGNQTIQTVQTVQSVQTINVKKEPGEDTMASTSGQPHTISVSLAPNPGDAQLVEATHLSDNGQHIVTQHENTDGTTSLSIAQVQTLQGHHQLTLQNLNQPNKNHNILVKKVFILKGNNTT